MFFGCRLFPTVSVDIKKLSGEIFDFVERRKSARNGVAVQETIAIIYQEFLHNLAVSRRNAKIGKIARIFSFCTLATMPIHLVRRSKGWIVVTAIVSITFYAIFYLFRWMHTRLLTRPFLVTQLDKQIEAIALAKAEWLIDESCVGKSSISKLVEKLAFEGRIHALCFVLLLEQEEEERKRLAQLALQHAKHEKTVNMLTDRFKIKMDQELFLQCCKTLDFKVLLDLVIRDNTLAQGGIAWVDVLAWETELSWCGMGGIAVSPDGQARSNIPKFCLDGKYRTPLEILLERRRKEGITVLAVFEVLGLHFEAVEDFSRGFDLCSILNQKGLRIRKSFITKGLVAQVQKEVEQRKLDGTWNNRFSYFTKFP